MLFNSLDFAVFLPVVFFLYWYVTNQNIKLQNALIVAASYVFYGWWDWRFLSLIIFSTFLDYSIGKRLKNEENQKFRTALLWTSIIVNLGFLGFFKYYNFFLDNFIAAFSFFGQEIRANSLNIILPVGISFYTFQTLSYTIDVYKKKLEPTEDLVAFSAFVCFFPQLVAGPIERATNLLPQFYKRRTFEYDKAIDGVRQILWGLFKKVVIADNCAEYANLIFSNYQDYDGITLLLGAIFFTFQIYGDFSGYSDIAIGTSRLFGITLIPFATPYYQEILQILEKMAPLSTWFGITSTYLWEEVEEALGRGSETPSSSSWLVDFGMEPIGPSSYGADLTLYFLPLLLMKRNRSNLGVVAEGRVLPSFRELVQMGKTFLLCVLAWVFFRADNLEMALSYLIGIVSNTSGNSLQLPYYLMLILILQISIDWSIRSGTLNKTILHKGLKSLFLTSVIFWLIILSSLGGNPDEFIYFQF